MAEKSIDKTELLLDAIVRELDKHRSETGRFLRLEFMAGDKNWRIFNFRGQKIKITAEVTD